MQFGKINFCIGLAIMLFISPYVLVAQNYKLVNTDAVTYLKKAEGADVIAVRIDSVAQVGDVTEYYNLREMRPTDYSCWIVDGYSWFGSKIAAYPDGKTQVILYPFSPGDSSDVYTIYTQAGIGDSWRFYYSHFDNPYRYVEATVDRIEQTEINGLTDMVKYIVLQCKDASGNIVSNPANGQEIMLSMNNGLLRTPKFDEFRHQPVFYDFFGKTNPDIGYKPPRLLDIFNFQAGDELHVISFDKKVGYNGVWSRTTGSIRRFLSRLDFPDGDSILYVFEECKSSHTIANGEHTYSSSKDTLEWQVSPSITPDFEKEPLEPVAISREGWRETDLWSWTHARHTYEYGFLSQGIGSRSYGAYVFTPDEEYENCFHPLITDSSCYYSGYFYEGLGGPYYVCYDDSPLGGAYRQLLYYKKGDVSWGTPLSCDSLLQVDVARVIKQSEFRVFPNPATDRIILKAESDRRLPAGFSLYDNAGRLVMYRKQKSPEESMQLDKLAPGCYYYRWIPANGNVVSGKLIRQ